MTLGISHGEKGAFALWKQMNSNVLPMHRGELSPSIREQIALSTGSSAARGCTRFPGWAEQPRSAPGSSGLCGAGRESAVGGGHLPSWAVGSGLRLGILGHRSSYPARLSPGS